MNYYDHHIGDYDADTAHLTWLEDMAYTRLLRLYYRKEAPIPVDVAQACRLVRAVSAAEKKAVDVVLHEFFELRDDGWHQDRCDAEIAAYKARVEHNRRVGKKGGRPRKTPTQEQPEANPKGSNQEPEQNPVGYFREPEQNPPQSPYPINHTSPSLRSGEGARDARPPTSRKRSEPRTLATFLASCREAGVKPIPDEHSIRRWAEDAGITSEMLQIAWLRFRERYTEDEKGRGKRYADWPRHFARAVKDNWFRLWYVGDDGVAWSALGLTHKMVLDKQLTREAEHEPA